MAWSGDPLADFDRWDAKQQKQLDRLPKCADCGEPIQHDHFYLINDEAICPDCLDAGYRKDVEDYVE
jgi:formylmethanofuran dehydrogenase subunit E